ALVRACADEVAGAGGAELWCNARMSAVGFYLRAGFEVVSDEFDVAGIGAHVVMACPVPA
ncbi:MAG: GNAT family N-acetyltransferase, partial [Acidimicrobiales bacterium]